MKHQFQVFALSAALILGFSYPSYAEQFQGFVESVNVADNSIVIMDPVTGNEKTLTVHSAVASSVKKGSVVKATFSPGSSVADTVEVLEAR